MKRPSRLDQLANMAIRSRAITKILRTPDCEENSSCGCDSEERERLLDELTSIQFKAGRIKGKKFAELSQLIKDWRGSI